MSQTDEQPVAASASDELTPIDALYDANEMLRRERNIWEQRARQAEARLDGAQEDISHLQAELAQAREQIAAQDAGIAFLNDNLRRAMQVVEAVRERANPRIKHLLPIAWHPLCDALAQFETGEPAAAERWVRAYEAAKMLGPERVSVLSAALTPRQTPQGSVYTVDQVRQILTTNGRLLDRISEIGQKLDRWGGIDGALARLEAQDAQQAASENIDATQDAQTP